MICLKIDYRFITIQWWEWSDKDKEETRYNLTGDKAICTYYKIKNTIFDIYKTLITDLWANKDVIHDAKDRNTIKYGDKVKILMNEKMIFVRSIFNEEDWTVYKQNMETGELELL